MNKGFQNNNVTYIEDLPDLSELTENQQQSAPENDKYKKFIRINQGDPLLESGMSRQPQQLHNHFDQPEGPIGMQPQQQHYYDFNNSPTCIEVANHIRMCPICSKFYNNDKTLYILCIILLAIVCVILMKKVLNV